MRLSEFWKRMEARFGATYARSLAADYRVGSLGATVNDAIERGESPQAVWRAVCQEFEVPQRLR
ncbi:MAG TPA: DUF3046 domain-containing protein [Jatrophihabitans sp.]|nr:DUF3046 domain-containing protein [Jatrophihabitans sp.]